MKLFETINRLQILHKLIEEECTGTPEELANRLNIKKAQLYNILDELKLRDAPILYSRKKSSFYYKYPYQVEIVCRLQPLNNRQMARVSGGSIFVPSSFIRRSSFTFAL